MEALQRLHNRGSISTGYDIDNSYKNENDNTERMYRPWGGITANTRTWTVSLWVKRTELGACYTWGAGVSGNDVLVVDFDSDDRLGFRSTISATNDCVYRTNRVFRDTSAWYHLVFAVDTTSSTAGNRLRIYVNGVEETSFATETNFDQNDLTMHNANSSYMEVGAVIGESPRFNGYIAEVNSITGTQYAPTAFGEFDEDTGIWKPIKFTGSYAENSVFLEFKDSSSLGTDTSGNSQTFTLQNLTAADQATDTPTNNFCTFNPLQTVRLNTGSGHKWTISNGATSAIQAADYGYMTHAGNIGFKKGKWYAEFKAGTGTSQAGVGMNQLDNTGAWEESYIGAYANATAIGMCKSQDGYFYRNGGSGALGVSWAAGDILGIAIVINDDGTGFMGMSKNGTWENSQNPSSGTSGMLGLYYGNALPAHLFHSFAVWTRRNNGAMLANFGGFPGFTISSANADANGYGNFEYAVPTGYYALCTKNLEEFG